MSNTPKILIVEDSKFFAGMLQRRITSELGFDVDWKSTYADAVQIIDCCKDQYLVALLDVTLPDAPNGEIVDYALKAGIPGIIFTGGLDSDQRNRFLSWSIVDYILKGMNSSMDYLIDTLGRIHKNQSTKTLVVDDSPTMRETLVRLLQTQLYQVEEAEDGAEALERIKAHPDIKLVLTDYDMPVMDGFELIEALRAQSDKSSLAIIGMSANEDPLLSARFIKSGANDFIAKPFQIEEFHCRISHAIEMIDNITLIKELSYKDYLTQLNNRRYFFENAPIFFGKAKAANQRCCVAMLDIDHFKAVNDSFGHDAGDQVLIEVSRVVSEQFKQDSIVCRFGGEEFCILFRCGETCDFTSALDDLRCEIEATQVPIDGRSISVTISAGACCEDLPLEDMIKTADNRLYEAKDSGRNAVVSR